MITAYVMKELMTGKVGVVVSFPLFLFCYSLITMLNRRFTSRQGWANLRAQIFRARNFIYAPNQVRKKRRAHEIKLNTHV